MKLQLIDRLHEKVRDHMKWDDAKTKLWFETTNPLFGGVSPFEYSLRRPDKVERVIDGMIYESSPPEGRD